MVSSQSAAQDQIAVHPLAVAVTDAVPSCLYVGSPQLSFPGANGSDPAPMLQGGVLGLMRDESQLASELDMTKQELMAAKEKTATCASIVGQCQQQLHNARGISDELCKASSHTERMCTS